MTIPGFTIRDLGTGLNPIAIKGSEARCYKVKMLFNRQPTQFFQCRRNMVEFLCSCNDTRGKSFEPWTGGGVAVSASDDRKERERAECNCLTIAHQ